MSSSPPSPFTESGLLADRNYWATFKDPLIRWRGELSTVAELGVERLFEFTRRILATAEHEEVMRVIESPSPLRFEPREGRTWYDFARERFEQFGEVYLFPGGGPTYQTGGRLRVPARLAYFKGNQIMEEEVEDPGLLLQSLHGTEEYIGRYSTTPIDLFCFSNTDEDWIRKYGPDTLRISLGLDTDIWFPRVIGEHAGDSFGRWPDHVPVHPARGRDRLMDNSALAVRHTPRLNRFIQTLREAVLELGGTWGFEPVETHEAYLPMIHDGGINLDYPAANA